MSHCINDVICGAAEIGYFRDRCFIIKFHFNRLEWRLFPAALRLWLSQQHVRINVFLVTLTLLLAVLFFVKLLLLLLLLLLQKGVVISMDTGTYPNAAVGVASAADIVEGFSIYLAVFGGQWP